VVLALGSYYFCTRLCTASSSDGLQYTDGDKELVERVAAGDERAMEAFLKFLYRESLDEDLTLNDLLTVLKVSSFRSLESQYQECLMATINPKP
jgi:hypothetical protein